MTHPIGPRLTKLMKTMKPTAPPRSDAEYAALLKRLGIVEPRPGRPRKGESRTSVIHHVRLPAQVDAALKARAKAARSTPTRTIRRLIADWALSS